ncbi:MAG: hypothetical protein A2201_11060, partial [Alicyclobacillus sp. RIFOXYA1_FULL_53_8]
MKIFQGGIEIAGQMGLFSKGLSQLGHQVSAYNTFTSYLGYYQNIQNLTSYELQGIFENTKSDYDVVHLHYAWPITENLQELRTLQEQGKVVLMHYWGNDVRTLAVAARHNPYARLIGDAEYVDPSLIEQRLRSQSQVIPACIVQDFEVVPYVSEYFKRVYVLPVTVDLAGIIPSGPRATTVPLVIHAPTLPEFKGTAIIEGVIDRLRNEGYVFRYERIHGLEHTEALRRYGEADIFVDQILAGSYGVFALEGMALGKPVLSYVREDLQYHFGPSLPIQSANPATLYEALRRLLVSAELRREVGSAGRQYVEQVHGLQVVARKLDWIYQQERLLSQANYSMDATLPSVIDLFGMQMDLQAPSRPNEQRSPKLGNVVPLTAKKRAKKNTNRRGRRKPTRSTNKVVQLATVRKMGGKTRRAGKPKVGGSGAKTSTARGRGKSKQRARSLTPATRRAKAAIASRRRRT